jgi:hypothetical protein
MVMSAHIRTDRPVLVGLIASIAVVAGCLFAPAAWADEQKDPDNFFKRAGKVIGRDAKRGAHQAGHAFKELGKDIGHGTSKAVKEVGQGMKNSAKRTGKAAKEATK